MSRSKAMYNFVSMDAAEIEADIAAIYTSVTGKAEPTGADKIFCQLLASVALYMSGRINYAGNQNLPSRASGADLDYLAEIFFEKTRPAETFATVTIEFTISEAQSTAILIPSGTRVTDSAAKVYFTTDEDVYVVAGETTASVHATCKTAGTIGNDYDVGELTNCVDVFPYYESCTNTTKSDGGSDALDDDEFYDLLVASQDAYSVAGPEGAYKYFAKKVSSEIADVVVNSPLMSTVYLYVLMNDGTIASSEIKNAVFEACDDKERRPLTDKVVVADPDEVTYNINLTYYIPEETTASAAATQQDIEDAVDEYIKWQSGKLGRDINPSKLSQMIMEAGAKRVTITSPVFTVLQDGKVEDDMTFEETVPQIAKVGTVTLTNGGSEGE